ncbi:unnamed protein product [Dovyalis caffra]|uniref:Uncharacterized protein n=1 Tax=Dovyalis caffra TaxID=77055 RepID=A0AAV1RNL2_9ROSI|nr:unnamed protein product [Dovyalis caffra]
MAIDWGLIGGYPGNLPLATPRTAPHSPSLDTKNIPLPTKEKQQFGQNYPIP